MAEPKYKVLSQVVGPGAHHKAPGKVPGKNPGWNTQEKPGKPWRLPKMAQVPHVLLDAPTHSKFLYHHFINAYFNFKKVGIKYLVYIFF